VIEEVSETTEQQTQRRSGMQATTTTRHFGPEQIKKAALAIAILASTAIGVTTATIVRDASDNDRGRAAVVSSAALNPETLFSYQFMEMNLDLPTGTLTPAVTRYADIQFMEQNLLLPGSSVAQATNPVVDYRFREMNLDLPGSVSSVAPNWRVIEENSWGEDFVFDGSTNESIAPSANDVPQQLTGGISY
jgi:hypothetical protein